MQIRRNLTIVAAALCLALFLSSCEDTGIQAPAGSTITLVANSVQINAEAGETQGTTRIRALLLSDVMAPLRDVPLAFSTTGGQLSSNICQANQCSRTGGTCRDDIDCSATDANAIETDDNGVAIALLTLTTFEDPMSVDVTVTSTASNATITIQMIITTGPIDPVPSITATPPDGQRTGRSFSFNGTSTRDPSIPRIYCWDWSIASATVTDITIRGANRSAINIDGVGSPTDPQRGDHDLSVRLRVSDEVVINCPNYDSRTDGADMPPSDELFSPNQAVLNYLIRCDLTPPNPVNAGNNRFLSLAGGTACQDPFDPTATCVSVSLQATASDPESTAGLRYEWDCGNDREGCQDPRGTCTLNPSQVCINNTDCAGAGTCQMDPTVWGACQSLTCQYDTVGSYTARVTVTNECGLATSDSLIVSVSE